MKNEMIDTIKKQISKLENIQDEAISAGNIVRAVEISLAIKSHIETINTIKKSILYED